MNQPPRAPRRRPLPNQRPGRPGAGGGSKIGQAEVSLIISAVLYFILALVLFGVAVVLMGGVGEAEGASSEDEMFGLIFGLGFGGFCAAIGVFVCFVVRAIKQRKQWGWVAGLVLGVLYATSIFLPLGIFVLVGLLSDNAQREFDPKLREEGIADEFA